MKNTKKKFPFFICHFLALFVFFEVKSFSFHVKNEYLCNQIGTHNPPLELLPKTG